jgi:hypothetical protein
MVSTNSDLRIAVFSDIHLGHRQNPTADIVDNLRRALPDNEETARLDMIILAGDVFDDLLEFNDEAVMEAEQWIADLLRLCAKHGIKLRVLEGTPSHDWKQSNQFSSINEFAKIGADLKYVKELAIEYEQDYDKWFLFVPDEWGPPEKTLSQIRSLMDARGLTHVDYAVMHGQFEFQMPEHIPAPKHDSDAYLQLVRHWIWIGHDHTYKTKDRIFVQGSFDRLTHGQEEAKGHVRTVVKDGKSTMRFVENRGAKIFKTIRCGGQSVEEALVEVREALATYPTGSFMRLELELGHPLIGNLNTLRQYYPDFNWTKEKVTLNGEVLKDAENEPVATPERDLGFTPITITRENIEEQVMSRIRLATVHGTNVIDAAEEILREVI